MRREAAVSSSRDVYAYTNPTWATNIAFLMPD